MAAFLFRVGQPVLADGKIGRLLQFSDYADGSVPSGALVQFGKLAVQFRLSKIEQAPEEDIQVQNASFSDSQDGQKIAETPERQENA